MRARSIIGTLLPPLAVFAIIFVGWELLVSVKDVQRFVLPSPSDVLDVLRNDRSALLDATLATLWEMVLGFALGAAIGFVFAVLLAHSRLARNALYPAFITTQAIPPIAIAAPLVIWLGYGVWPKAIIVALLVFFPVLVNTYQGLRDVDDDMLLLMQSMGASTWQTFRRVRLPASAPLVFAALKLAATYCVIGAIFGEWVGAEKGLGVYILEANSQLQTDRVYAAIFVLAGISIAFFLLAVAAEWLATPWRRRSTVRRWRRRTPDAARAAGPVSQGGFAR
jgi:ABC-type nitrate/sulfonate/bicarbonate transport system permease component